MTAEWTLHDVARATGAPAVAAMQARLVSGAALDSRRLAPGRVFVPLAGARADGHAFVAAALGAGAAGSFCRADRHAEVLAACGQAGVEFADRLLVVADVEAALGAWARARRAAWAGELVGLCGSNGKTTTKEMLASIFARRAPTGRTEGNLNNQLGVPVTLTRLAAVERYAVVEIGMNHPGEVRALAALARPSAAVITNIGPEHLEGLGSLDAVARAEAEIGEALPPGAPLVVPADDERLEACTRDFAARRVTFGLAAGADYVATDVELRGAAGARFRVAGFPPLTIPVPGLHSVKNALAALACAHVSGVTPEECARGLAATPRPAGRTEVELRGGVTLLLDHYNANPASLDAALDLLESWPGARGRYAALGDMLELGPTAPQWHAAAGRRLPRLDGAFLWGPLMAHALEAARAAEPSRAERVTHHADRRSLGRALAAVLGPGDVVLVKGSRGSAMEETIEVLRDALGGATAQAGEGR